MYVRKHIWKDIRWKFLEKILGTLFLEKWMYSQHQPFSWSDYFFRKNKKGTLTRHQKVNMNSCELFFIQESGFV